MSEEKPAKIKISYRHNPDAWIDPKYLKKNSRAKSKDKHYCLACGALLTDPVSIERGFGRGCWESVPLVIVLEIEPANVSG